MITATESVFILEFDYDPAIIADVRKLPGRRAEPEMGIWTVPIAFAPAVHEFARKHSIPYMEGAETIGVATSKNATAHYNGKQFEVYFDYDKELAEAIANIENSTWFQPKTCWLIPADQGLAVNDWAELASARLTNEAEEQVAECQTLEQRVIMSGAKESDYELRSGFGLELYDYQRAGVEYVVDVAKGRCIIGDEPGVGKTAVAMAVIHQLDAFPAIIVCPASLKINWRREIRRALPNASVEIIRGTKPVQRLFWSDVTIINYDILDAWRDVLPATKSVTLDESHKIKNPRIARTKAAIAVMDRSTGPRLCLTGTAVVNEPNEVMTQLRAIGQIQKFGGDAKARRTYKNRPKKLNYDMRKRCYIRRRKQDVWTDAPERNWAELVVEGDPTVMAEYWKAEKDIVRYLAERAERAAIESGATTAVARQQAWQTALRAEAAKHLVAISHLKQLAAQAKKPMLIEWAQTFLESGEKLGVFGWHTDTVDTMARALRGVKVQGGQSEAERQQSVDLFQSNEQVRVICGQILAAGEGLTLTAASNALLVEQAWTPGAMDQVLDRFHRRGQVNDVVGWLAIIEGTIDVDIRELIERKRVTVTETLDGYTPSDEENGGTVLQDLVVRLAKRGMEQ